LQKCDATLSIDLTGSAGTQTQCVQIRTLYDNVDFFDMSRTVNKQRKQIITEEIEIKQLQDNIRRLSDSMDALTRRLGTPPISK
jgi:hypothetical protein